MKIDFGYRSILAGRNLMFASTLPSSSLITYRKVGLMKRSD